MQGYMALVMRAKKGLWVWEMALKSEMMGCGQAGAWFYFPFGRIRDEHVDKLVDVERESKYYILVSIYYIDMERKLLQDFG